MLAWKSEGTRLYQQLPARLHAGLRPVEPLHAPTAEQEAARTRVHAEYRTWNETRARADG
jgi:hypothetical protein